MSKSDEMILVVPTELFKRIGYFQGFHADAQPYRRLLSPENLRFMRRGDMEKDPSYKQLIPYILLLWTDPQTGAPWLFTYTRGTGMGEARLHAKMSVGVGGHINNTDMVAGGCDPYWEGLLRELHEEVRLDPAIILSERCAGLINDDDTEVGTVHLGVVHIFELARPEVVSNEPDLLQSGFRPVEELKKTPDAFESWSRISIEALF